MKIRFEDLEEQISQVFLALNFSEKNAKTMGNVMAAADARGVYTHGVHLMLKYIKFCQDGIINPNPNVKVCSESPSAVTIDGDHGLGGIVVTQAVDLLAQKASETGCATAIICNTIHYGAGAYYMEQLAKKNMIGYLYANADRQVVPFGGAETFLGTNPYSFGAPAGARPPFILDMATTQAAGNKIEVAFEDHKQIPEGWGVDAEGRPTTDPAKVLNGGSLCHFGGIKGYGISFMIDVVAGILSGGAYRVNEVRSLSKTPTVGFFLQAIDISKFIPADTFNDHMTAMIDELKTLKKAPGVKEVYYPGEIEGNNYIRSMRDGVELRDRAYNDFADAAGKLGVKF